MGSERGPVLLDFSSTPTKSRSPELQGPCTLSGYRMGNIVLTIAPNILNNNLKSQGLMDSDSGMKISCYWLDNCSVKEEHHAHVCHVWKIKYVNEVIANLKKYNLKPFIVEGDRIHAVEYDVSFMLIKLGNKKSDTRAVKKALVEFSNYSKSQKLTHGQDVFTVYAPFGANEFMNSHSRGCLSNKFKEGMFLIDGRLAPGCEGAPLFTKSDITSSDFPIGIVLFPIAMGNDHSSYSLVVPVSHVIDALLSSQTSGQIETTPTSSSSFSWISKSLKDGVDNVMVVETPCSWGSGIVVNRGLVITNAHVIGFNQESAVTLRWMNTSTKARVLFVTMKSSLLDIAVLQYNKAFGPPGIRFSREDPELGERVLALGNPLQISSDVPSLSKGVVLNHWKKSAGFSTSCIINAGSSGGAILREDGTLLGIVVGICKSDKRAYPEINVCISASILYEPLLSYIQTGDLSRLQSLLNYEDTWLRTVMNYPKSKY